MNFTMARLIEAKPCSDGLDRLTNNLGEFTGATVLDLASSQFDECTISDLLWCLKVTELSQLDQKMLCVKVAIYAAERVVDLADSPTAAAAIAAAKDWVNNPCTETTNSAASDSDSAAYASAAYADYASAAYASASSASAASAAASAADYADYADYAASESAEAVGGGYTNLIRNYLTQLLKQNKGN